MNYIIRDEISTRKQIFLPFVREVFCNKTKRNGNLCNQRLQGIFGYPIEPSIFINNNLNLKSTVYDPINRRIMISYWVVVRQRLDFVYFSMHVHDVTFSLFAARSSSHKTSSDTKKSTSDEFY